MKCLELYGTISDQIDEVDHFRLVRHEEIKSGLRLRSTSLAKVGRDLGVQNSTMTLISKGVAKSKRIQKRLAEELEVPDHELWPECFQEDVA